MCFTLAWLAQLCVEIICIVATIMIINILIPWLLSVIPIATPLAAIIRIVLWAIVACIIVYFCFDLLACLWNFARMRTHSF